MKSFIFTWLLLPLSAHAVLLEDGPMVVGERVRPFPSVLFQLESTVQGFLPPRMTTAQRDAISNPQQGLQIHNLDSNTPEFWTGSNWSSSLGGVGGLGVDGCAALWDGTGTPLLKDSTICRDEIGDTDVYTLSGGLLVNSTTLASRPCPVMEETERDLLTPNLGDCIVNSDEAGYEYFDGNQWSPLGGGGSSLQLWEPGFTYEEDDVVLVKDLFEIYIANTQHLSTVFLDDIANWDIVPDVSGKLEKFPSETEDNRLVRTDGDGNALQGSGVILDDSDAISGVTQLDVDNVRIDGNTISSTDTDGPLNFIANGTGIIDLQSPVTALDMEITGELEITGSLVVDNLSFDGNTISSLNPDGDINFVPNGTGAITTSADVFLNNLDLNQVLFLGDTDKKIEGSDNFLYVPGTDQLRAAGLDFGSAEIRPYGTGADLTLGGHAAGGKVVLPDEEANSVLFLDDVDKIVTSVDYRFYPVTKTLNVGDVEIDGDTSSIGSTGANQDFTLIASGTGGIQNSFDAGATVQTLDRQQSIGELLPNSGFERGDLSMVSCTNATLDRIPSLAGGEFNDWALQITSTGTSWSCDIAGAASEGQGVLSASLKSSVVDTQICALVNSTEQICDSIRVTGQPDRYSYPVVLGATANSVRIKGATSGDVVKVDMVGMQQGALPELVYQARDAVVSVSSGAFTGGSLLFNRVGNAVTIQSTALITHADLSSANSAAGLIPLEYRPSSTVMNTYYSNTADRHYTVIIRDDGSIGLEYAGETRTDSVVNFSIGFSVADSQSAQSFSAPCLGFECENEFNARVDDGAPAPVLSSNLSGWISGNSCVRSTTGTYICTFATSLFGAIPECQATAIGVGSINATAVSTTTDVTVYTRTNSTDVLTDSAFALDCNRTTDFIKQKQITGTVGRQYVSGGVEVFTGDTWDGTEIYRRCFEVVSNITTTTTIATIESGLNPVELVNYAAAYWLIIRMQDATGSNSVTLTYDRSNGELVAGIIGSYKLGAGTRFCLEYTK